VREMLRPSSVLAREEAARRNRVSELVEFFGCFFL